MAVLRLISGWLVQGIVVLNHIGSSDWRRYAEGGFVSDMTVNLSTATPN
jgi:hypothetical protein